MYRLEKKLKRKEASQSQTKTKCLGKMVCCFVEIAFKPIYKAKCIFITSTFTKVLLLVKPNNNNSNKNTARSCYWKFSVL